MASHAVAEASAAVLAQLPPDQRQAVMAAYQDAYAAGVGGTVQIVGSLPC